MDNLYSVANATSAYASQEVSKTNNSKTEKSEYGKTIGKPQLSEAAAKYYEKLKSKFSGMDFVLVSKDEKENAKAQAASYANPNKMVVLIDEEKIERMAADEDYRKKYESVIAQSAMKMSSLGDSVHSQGADIKGFGMQVNDDGTATYFAVLEKSTAAQKERIAKKAAEKKAEKTAEAKKEAKEAEAERLKDKGRTDKTDAEDTVTLTASSVEELIQKIQDQVQMFRTDSVQTEAEKMHGQNFDLFV